MANRTKSSLQTFGRGRSFGLSVEVSLVVFWILIGLSSEHHRLYAHAPLLLESSLFHHSGALLEGLGGAVGICLSS
jgi:hypothetical protein